MESSLHSGRNWQKVNFDYLFLCENIPITLFEGILSISVNLPGTKVEGEKVNISKSRKQHSPDEDDIQSGSPTMLFLMDF